MTQREAEEKKSVDLWRRILAAPGDEDLKAQFIEALGEEEDPRAEMFRVADELHHLVHGYFEKEAKLRRQYEEALLPWRIGFEAAAEEWGAAIKFIWGWPIEVTISARDFIKHAVEIVAAMPLRHLNLTGVAEALDVFEVIQLEQITSLDVSNQPWSSERIKALASSYDLSALCWLDLSRTGITDAEVEALAASKHLKNLLYVNLAGNPCRDPADAACGYGVDGISGLIVSESIWLPEFGRELEDRYGEIKWLHSLAYFMEKHPPQRYAC